MSVTTPPTVRRSIAKSTSATARSGIGARARNEHQRARGQRGDERPPRRHRSGQHGEHGPQSDESHGGEHDGERREADRIRQRPVLPHPRDDGSDRRTRSECAGHALWARVSRRDPPHRSAHGLMQPRGAGPRHPSKGPGAASHARPSARSARERATRGWRHGTAHRRTARRDARRPRPRGRPQRGDAPHPGVPAARAGPRACRPGAALPRDDRRVLPRGRDPVHAGPRQSRRCRTGLPVVDGRPDRAARGGGRSARHRPLHGRRVVGEGEGGARRPAGSSLASGGTSPSSRDAATRWWRDRGRAPSRPPLPGRAPACPERSSPAPRRVSPAGATACSRPRRRERPSWRSPSAPGSSRWRRCCRISSRWACSPRRRSPCRCASRRWRGTARS